MTIHPNRTTLPYVGDPPPTPAWTGPPTTWPMTFTPPLEPTRSTRLTIPLGGNPVRVVTVDVPPDMTQAEWSLMRVILESMRAGIVQSPPVDPDAPKAAEVSR